jgi:hypothetical protein
MNSRAERLEAKDLNGYLESLDPNAQMFERALAQGSFSVPLTDPRLELQRSSIQHGLPMSGVRVQFEFGYQGLPEDNRFTVDLSYGLGGQGENLRITSASLPDGESLPLWASGPVQVLRSEHFLALFRPGLPKVEQVVAAAETARTQLEARLDIPLEDAQLMVLAKDEAEFALVANSGRPSSAAVALASFAVSPEAMSVGGRQIVVNVEGLYKDGMGLETLQHEFAHLALLKDTRPTTPGWVSEGAAMYLAGKRPDDLWQAGAESFARLRFRDLAGASLGEHDITGSFEYAYAAAAAWYLIENFEPIRFWQFYRSYAEVSPRDLYDRLPSRQGAAEPNPEILALSAETTERALNEVFGFGQDELDTRVKEWISKLAR